MSRNLDFYIEAQIHGPIDLKEDVVALVADGSFRGTPIEKLLIELCRKFQIQLEWHQGYRLQTDKVPDNFRGKDMPLLAKRVHKEEIMPTKLGEPIKI